MNDALLLIDVQHPYTASNPETVEALRHALPGLREKMPLIWVFMGEAEADSKVTQLRGRNLRHVFHDNTAHGLRPSLHPQGQDFVTLKAEMDAFTNQNLAGFLTGKYIQTVYLAGFLSSQCVLESALGALRHSFNTGIFQNLTADRNDQQARDFQEECAARKIALPRFPA